MESFTLSKNIASIDTLNKEIDFDSEWNYQRAYSSFVISELYSIVENIIIPLRVDSVSKLRFVKCHYDTHAYAIWYITFIDNSKNHYYFYYEDNSGISNIESIGVLKGKDYIWKTANMLYNNREGKNNDYMVFGEIEDNNFNSFKATQTFSIGDNLFFKMILDLVEMKECK